MNNNTARSPGILLQFLPGLLFLSVVFSIELIAILVMNSGHFIYTLDDPYIHLTLAGNIAKGHYGLNLNEFSAPSSSIIWPFLLAPFSLFKHFELVPLILNFIVSAGTVFFFTRIARRSVILDNKKMEFVVIAVLLAGLIVCTNVVSLIFTGMEHSLQVLIAVMIMDGLVADSENESSRFLLAIAIMTAPLVRYENLALSVAAIGYLFFRKRFGIAIVCTLFIVLSEIIFSMYLANMGLGPIPTSILSKSLMAGDGNGLLSFLGNLLRDLATIFVIPRALLLVGALAVLSIVQWTSVKKSGRLLAWTVSAAIAMHLVVGSYGAYNRYGIYIWTVVAIAMIYLFGEAANRFLTSPAGKKRIPVFVVVFSVAAIVASFTYIRNVFLLPLASNNIYEQHFQMRRFAVDFYRKPIAVNDIGLVSYRNGNYILDLYGLASLKVFSYHRMKNPGVAWMDELAKENNVRFAMIYDVWFPKVPENWIKAGELYLGKKDITPEDSVVAFYACDRETYDATKGLLEEFGKTLPTGVRFVGK